MIKIVAKNIVKEDKIEEFKKLAKELVCESLKEEGCLFYGLHQDVNNHNVLTFIEGWKNQEAIEKHNSSKHFISLFPELKKLNKDVELNIYNEIIF